MTFPLIGDPYFYAVALPAVLLLGISKSGFGAGFGSLAVPLIALAVPVPTAAASQPNCWRIAVCCTWAQSSGR